MKMTYNAENILKKYFGRLICFLFLILAAQYSTAQSGLEDHIYGIPLTGTAATYPSGSTTTPLTLPLTANQVSVIDYNGLPLQSVQQSKQIKNVITFRIKEETTNFISQDFSITATVQIDYGHSSTSYNTISKALTVNYKRGAGEKYDASQYFSFDNAEYVKITLTALPSQMVGSVDVKDLVYLENKMMITRFFELPNTVPAPSSLAYETPVDPVPDHLKVNWIWPVNTGNNATQLEWVWIENESEESYKTAGVLNYNLVFNKSTRIDLPYKKLFYDVPLLYDGIGKLYFRIRAVNIKDNGNRSDGPWSTPYSYSFSGHNNKLNWQATTTFAEEGKRKTVIQYFDGSLRSRQTVTKDNSTNTVITAESFYDAQGRPAIQILPTPGISEIIEYKANLNLFNGQMADQDPAEIFDMQPAATIANPVVSSATPPMVVESGSSRYYSDQNDELSDGPNKNIPDAEGYPYTVTRYTPDATGRIMSQSGVGGAHKMGGGHETKYYYGTPAQEELYGLFGTEVGNFTHYSKNMVKDANGQMSVSYVDMHGRTIATALAGDSPASLRALDKNDPLQYPNQAGTQIIRNLLDPATNIIAGDNIESINSLLVPALTNYNFRYELNPQILELAACEGKTPSTLCYDCMYDLEIAISDESGETLPIIKKFSNVSLNPDDNCSTPTPGFKDLVNNISNVITFEQALPPGSYSIRKTLTISESSFQKYKELYMSKALCKTEQQVIDSVYNVLLTTSNCGVQQPLTCESCNAQLGDENTFTQHYLETIGMTPPAIVSTQIANEIHAAYLQAKSDCDMLCTTISQSLPAIRQLMLSDMMPFSGQYAQKNFTDYMATGGSHSMFEKYNIFSSGGFAHQPFFKNPWKNGVKDFYYDDFGNKDNLIHPEIAPAADYTFLNSITNDIFTTMFTESWASALLPHHPEYARLVFAEALTPSYNWINTFQQAYTWAGVGGGSSYMAATPATLPTPNPAVSPVANDPFFAAAPVSYRDRMVDDLNNYKNTGVSVWQLAYGQVMCKTLPESQIPSCYAAAPTGVISFAIAADNDKAWAIYNSVYAAIRNDLINEYIAVSRPLSAPTDEADLIAQHYHLWFPVNNQQTAANNGWDWWPALPGHAPVYTPDGTNPAGASYTDICASYIERWKTQLLQCVTLANRSDKEAILTEITDRMKVVCINGSNPANSMGASSVAPGTPASVTDRSFEDVIRNVFHDKGIMNSDGTYLDGYCNPFVIEWPKPYGKGPALVSGAPAAQIDSCNCKQYADVKADAIAHNVDITSLTAFNQYLLAAHGDTLTPVMYAAVQLHCGSQSDTCVCGNLKQIKDLFLILNPNGFDQSCPPPPVDLIINSRTGNQPAEYVASSSITFNPGFESGVNDEFRAYISNIANCDPATLCQTNFANFFNTHYGAGTGNYTWLQIAALYLSTCGEELDVCHVKEDNLVGSLSNDTTTSPPQNLEGGVPKNDDLCNAISLTAQPECSFTTYSNEDATTEAGIAPPSCDALGLIGSDIWFKITLPAATPLLVIDTKYMGLTDGVMAVYTATGACPSLSLTEVACSDDDSDDFPSMPKVTLSNIAAGTTYYVRFWGLGGETGTFGICVKAPPVPVNDDCANAVILPVNNDLICDKVSTGTLEAATPSAGILAASCSTEDQANDIWYQFTAAAGSHIVSVFGGSPISLAAYSGTCGALNEIECSTNKVLELFNLTIGNIYYVRISGSTSTVFTVCVRTVPPPVNCTASVVTYTLPSPQPMPNFLTCGYVPDAHCVSCAGLSTYTAEYKALFKPQVNTAPLFTSSPVTDEQLDYNRNFARFINYRTGFRFDWLDYSAAAAHSTPPCNLAAFAANTAASQNVICGNTKPLAEEIILPPVDPCAPVHDMAVSIGQHLYQIRTEQLMEQFNNAYKAKCFAAKDIEQFTATYTTSEYHYTLYYYDLGGNLVKTIPPKGVRPDFSITFTNSVKASVTSGDYLPHPIRPAHMLLTDYRYNSLNQVISQMTPDAGISNFWYDVLGRLVVSQNAQQMLDNKYSYTLYDALGRIAEVGQKPQAANSMNQAISQNITTTDALSNWINVTGGTKEQITATVYDLPFDPLSGAQTYMTQQNLRNRVSYTYTKKLDTDIIPGAATYYTYDVHGNVDKLLQDSYDATLSMAGGNSRFKLMTYKYDLISGKVNSVDYQPGFADAFYHRYHYDAENRITGVEVSRDKILWERDASYSYYKHGPLARAEIGQQRVQGIDYAYTLHGWLKGVNQTTPDASFDMGQDGTSTTVVAKDVLGFGLHYYDEETPEVANIDYIPIGAQQAFARPAEGSLSSLYNGNIAAMSVSNEGLLKADAGTNNTIPLFYRYTYDQLNRIAGMVAYKGLDAESNAWQPIAMSDYRESISYDPNGNITIYKRNGTEQGGTSMDMDNLRYKYLYTDQSNIIKQYDPLATLPTDVKSLTNKLAAVKDEVPDGKYPADIDNQADLNYTYDAIGNLTSDAKEHISNIQWTVYGKIAKITKTDGTEIKYQYDPSGNRTAKLVTPFSGTVKTTYYVRDASGNVMSVYESAANDAPVQAEAHIYGSSRLGMQTQLTVAPATALLDGGFNTGLLSTFTRGEKIFELSNHLGNVLATVTDKKIQKEIGYKITPGPIFGSILMTTEVEWPYAGPDPQDVEGPFLVYKADVMTAGDYYPGGMNMPGRRFSINNDYRYGFNGQENSEEIAKGLTTAMYWEYDSRIGRRWNIDPVQGIDESPYLCFNGNPVLYSDVLGDEAEVDGGKKKKKAQAPQASIPALQFTREKLVSVSTQVVRMPLMNISTTKAKFIPQNPSSQAYFSQGHDDYQYQIDYKAKLRMDASMQNAVMDPFAASVVNAWGTTASGLVNGTINGIRDHSEGIYDGIKYKNYSKAVWNTVGLALDVAPFAFTKGFGTAAKVEEAFLYRFDTRAPAELLESGGFKAWGTNKDVFWHAEGTTGINKTSGFVSTSSDLNALEKVVGSQKGYIYKIRMQKNGINVNELLGPKSPHPGEMEVAVPDQVPFKDILGYKAHK